MGKGLKLDTPATLFKTSEQLKTCLSRKLDTGEVRMNIRRRRAAISSCTITSCLMRFSDRPMRSLFHLRSRKSPISLKILRIACAPMGPRRTRLISRVSARDATWQKCWTHRHRVQLRPWPVTPDPDTLVLMMYRSIQSWMIRCYISRVWYRGSINLQACDAMACNQRISQLTHKKCIDKLSPPPYVERQLLVSLR